MEVLSPYFLLFLLLQFGARAQSCTVCITQGSDSLSYYISVADTNDYIVGNGQTFCIAKGITYKGTITLSGGTICNRGRLVPDSIIFNSGEIINNGLVLIKHALSVGSAKTITNAQTSVFNVHGSLTLSGGTLINEGILNTSDNLVNSSGSLTNKSIINCQAYSGGNTIQNFSIGVVNEKN